MLKSNLIRSIEFGKAVARRLKRASAVTVTVAVCEVLDLPDVNCTVKLKIVMRDKTVHGHEQETVREVTFLRDIMWSQITKCSGSIFVGIC